MQIPHLTLVTDSAALRMAFHRMLGDHKQTCRTIKLKHELAESRSHLPSALCPQGLAHNRCTTEWMENYLTRSKPPHTLGCHQARHKR